MVESASSLCTLLRVLGLALVVFVLSLALTFILDDAMYKVRFYGDVEEGHAAISKDSDGTKQSTYSLYCSSCS
jgi:hypothetical protein